MQHTHTHPKNNARRKIRRAANTDHQPTITKSTKRLAHSHTPTTPVANGEQTERTTTTSAAGDTETFGREGGNGAKKMMTMTTTTTTLRVHPSIHQHTEDTQFDDNFVVVFIFIITLCVCTF